MVSSYMYFIQAAWSTVSVNAITKKLYKVFSFNTMGRLQYAEEIPVLPLH